MCYNSKSAKRKGPRGNIQGIPGGSFQRPFAVKSQGASCDDTCKMLASGGVWAPGVYWELVTWAASGLVGPEMPGFQKKSRSSA